MQQQRKRTGFLPKMGITAAVLTILAPIPLANAYVAPVNVTTVAGDGQTGNQDGAALQAEFRFPTGIAVASDGTMYVSDTRNQRIRVIHPQGIVSTLAGYSSETDVYGNPVGGDTDGPAMLAQFNDPMGLALSPDGGTLFIADTGNGAIRALTFATGEVTTLVKGLASPSFIVAAPDGTLYVSETDKHRILHVNQDGTWTVLAGGAMKVSSDGTWQGGLKDGTGVQAQFQLPEGLALGMDGTLYVVDSGNQRIRAVSPKGVVTTIAGSGTELVDGDTTLQGGYADGRANQAQFNFPTGLTIGADGTLYVADTYNHCIRTISPQGIVNTLAGSTTFGRADGFEDTAEFDGPTGIAMLQDGTIVTVDQWTDSVREVRSFQLPKSVLPTGTGWAVIANNQVLTSTVSPQMIGHHLYLPLDAVAKAFGMTLTTDSATGAETVTWAPSGTNATGTRANTSQTASVMAGDVSVSGSTPFHLPEAPVLRSGTLLVPWEFATQVLGLHLNWMPAEHVYVLRLSSANGS